MGRWFPGGRNRLRGLSLIVDDDDDDDDDDEEEEEKEEEDDDDDDETSVEVKSRNVTTCLQTIPMHILSRVFWIQ